MWVAHLIAVMIGGSAVAPEVDKMVAIPVAVALMDGQCSYRNTDVGLTATQLEAHLARIADKSLRVEMLLVNEPPEKCVAESVSAAWRAGFRRIAVRPATAKDVFGGPPR
jgi:hypothetical protein